MNRASSFFRLALHSDGTPWHPGPTSLPFEGELESPYVDRLTQLLRSETATPQHVWVLVWSGYFGSFAVGTGKMMARAGRLGRRRQSTSAEKAFEISKSLTASGRSYVLRKGAIDSHVHDEPGFHSEYSPGFWWPADRAWFVSTDIDSRSTYVGGSRELVDGLLADDLLEVFPAQLDDPYDGEASPEEVRSVLTR